MKRNYGWVIVGAMLFVQAVSSGLGFYNMSVYMTEFTRTLQLPLADVSFAVSLFFIVGGIAGIYVARLMERVHVRWIMVVGALLAGGALGLVGQADSLWQIYALFIVFGIGNTGVSLVVATTLVTQWFPGPERSIALSTASTGLSLGGVIFTPATAYLFNSMGWEATMPWLGLAFVLLILPFALWVVRPAPILPVIAVGPNDSSWTYHDAIRSRLFILLAVAYIFCQAAQVGGISHLYNRVEQVAGFEAAARAIQILTLCSIAFRFLGGWLVMHVSIRAYAILNVAIQCIGLLLISSATDANDAWLGAAVFGASIGNILMLQPLWLAEAFPGSIYPKVFALANAAAVVGVAGGPYILGVSYDFWGYENTYFVAVVLSFVAGCFMLFAGANPRPPAGTSAPDPVS